MYGKDQSGLFRELAAGLWNVFTGACGKGSALFHYLYFYARAVTQHTAVVL
jgi:hypothetical protein